MELENLLVTRIKIAGSFQNVTLYSGVLYLLKSPTTLYLYDWNKWIQSASIGDVPIYRDPFPSQNIEATLETLNPFFIRAVAFPSALKDFFVYNHVLYYIDESGFWNMSMERQDAVKQRLREGNFLELLLSNKKRVALVAGEKGIYEYLLSPAYSLGLPAVDEEERFYLLDAAPTYHAEWHGHDLLQSDEQGQAVQLLSFRHSRGQLTLFAKIPATALTAQRIYFSEELPLFQKDLTPTNALFTFFKHGKSAKKSNPFKQQAVPIYILSHPLFPEVTFSNNVITVSNGEKELVIQLNNAKLLALDKAAILRWHHYDRSRYYRNQLHIVEPEQVILYLFTELEPD
ncbi:Hypothetical protein Tpal_43 [Trichococcus palustris]|uniref:Uncharacterized protein n=1 Tax=Trichococcus palustris TaxID=140314 RepID=A0A143Y5H0_9LACT|nr:hypothetical protein [Trichococcus palustris]CZQ80160.1 Hypothetical protein Tpal_43 [Trichococcus palustris]SFL08517.1 hypothetical protein SAMN04488076_11810 [Trichococcus palustris]